MIVIIVVGARLWRLLGRDLEFDAKRGSLAMALCGALLIAIGVTVDLYGILFVGIGVLLLIVARFLRFLSESARLDKYQTEED